MSPHQCPGLPLRSLNHISRVCRDVAASATFYREVLGFQDVKRPASFDFDGAWLFRYGVGIHLISGCPPVRDNKINPKADHLSFQADSLEDVEAKVISMELNYVKQTIDEGGVRVTQLFFHDPDNNMIEVCNCDLLPVVPLDSADAVVVGGCIASACLARDARPASCRTSTDASESTYMEQDSDPLNAADSWHGVFSAHDAAAGPGNCPMSALFNNNNGSVGGAEPGRTPALRV